VQARVLDLRPAEGDPVRATGRAS
ncbi:uncharacterized protein METZ01_LOCUS507585, partial [marine metagenome]